MRNVVVVVRCSKGPRGATTVGEEKDVPPLVDRTVTIASGRTPSLNRRQAICSAPLTGSMARAAPCDRRGCVGTGWPTIFPTNARSSRSTLQSLFVSALGLNPVCPQVRV